MELRQGGRSTCRRWGARSLALRSGSRARGPVPCAARSDLLTPGWLRKTDRYGWGVPRFTARKVKGPGSKAPFCTGNQYKSFMENQSWPQIGLCMVEVQRG